MITLSLIYENKTEICSLRNNYRIENPTDKNRHIFIGANGLTRVDTFSMFSKTI